MSECAKHPGQETMVVCMSCGRSFCRLCEPPRGSGLYCSNCYQEQLERLSGKKEKKEESKPKASRRAKPAATGQPAGFAAKAAAPFKLVGRKVSAGTNATGKAFVRVGRGIKAGAIAVVVATGKGLQSTAFWANDHFPFGLTDAERLEGEPPLVRDWYKLLGIVLGGTIVWTILVALTHVRNPGFSIGIAAIVAWAAVWVMGKRFGPAVGVVTVGLVLVSLAFGELAVQLLYRGGIIIKKLDLQTIDLKSKTNTAFYSSFTFRLALYRMLPAAVVAFFIGWWPLKLRPSWVGFESHSVRARTLPPFKRRSEVKRPGAATKTGSGVVAKKQESRKQAAE